MSAPAAPATRLRNKEVTSKLFIRYQLRDKSLLRYVRIPDSGSISMSNCQICRRLVFANIEALAFLRVEIPSAPPRRGRRKTASDFPVIAGIIYSSLGNREF